MSDDELPGLARMSSRAGRWIIVATVLGSGMAAIDATVVGIALPSIGRQFHAQFNVLQWVVTGYSLTLASLLLVGGALGDRFGRRRVFSIGVVWFTLASAACALSVDPAMLVATRVLQGVGAALLTPGSLAIIQASFDPKDRARAIGAWSGLGGVATAAGPLLGGYLIVAASWRWIFVINLPLGAAVLVLTSRHVPESRDPNVANRIDVPGAAAAVAALGGIVFGLIDGPSLGWGSPLVLGALAFGGACAITLVVVERRSPAPMLPVSFLAVRQFSVTNAVTLLVYAGLTGMLFLLPIELQIVDRYTPLESGAALLPLTVLMLALSSRSGRLAAAIGPRLQMSTGPVVVGVGLVLLSRTAADSHYVTGVLPGVIVLGLGLAATVAPLTATALGAIPVEHAGLASAFNNDVARLGGLLAVAVLPAAAGITGQSYLHPTQLAGGFRTSIDIAAALCALGGVLAAIGISNEGATRSQRAVPELDGGGFHCGLDATPLATTSRSFEGCVPIALRYGAPVGTPVAVTERINAPADKVWGMVADLPRMGEWSPENDGAEWLRGARSAAVGATFKGANSHGSKSWTTRGVIVTADPGRALAFRISAAGMRVAEWRYEFESTDGGCTVTETFIDERGPLVKWIGKVMMRVGDRDSHNRATMQTTLAKLKVAAESLAGP